MDNIRVRCRSCNKEIEGHLNKTISCGCSNMTTIRGDKISAVDLSLVVMLNSKQSKNKTRVLSDQDILWQEERRQRKVRKLDFEVRWKNFGKYGSIHWEVLVILRQNHMITGLQLFAPLYLYLTWLPMLLLYPELLDTGIMYLERVRLVEDTALKAAEGNTFAGSIPVLSVFL